MEFLLGFFTGLAIQYWVLLVLFFGSLVYTAYEEEFNAFTLSGLIAIGYFSYSNIKPEFIDWNTLIVVVLIYFGIGLVWSFKKWFSFARVKYIAHVDSCKRTEINLEFKLNVSENKERIGIWIMYWPLSMIGYIIGDLLKDLLDWVVSRFGGFYNYLTEKAKGY